jgi:hypothetical protein
MMRQSFFMVKYKVCCSSSHHVRVLNDMVQKTLCYKNEESK